MSRTFGGSDETDEAVALALCREKVAERSYVVNGTALHVKISVKNVSSDSSVGRCRGTCRQEPAQSAFCFRMDIGLRATTINKFIFILEILPESINSRQQVSAGSCFQREEEPGEK